MIGDQRSLYLEYPDFFELSTVIEHAKCFSERALVKSEEIGRIESVTQLKKLNQFSDEHSIKPGRKTNFSIWFI